VDKKNNLEKFLIWEYLEEPKKFGWEKFQSDWGKKWGKGKYNRYGMFIDFFDKTYNFIQSKLLSKLYFKKQNNKILFFCSLKYKHIIFEAKKYYSLNLNVSGIGDRLFAIKYFMEYFPINKCRELVTKYIEERRVKHLYRLIELIKIKLEYLKPDFIVLHNDSFPIERALVLVGKKLKISTIVIQHGQYDSTTPLTDGKVADYILVWGKYFKDLYIKNGIRKPNDLYILGYPYQIDKNNMFSKGNNNYTVCYLGQKWEQYSNILSEAKIVTIKKLFNICIKLRIDFIYRPHPGEDIELIKNNISYIKFTRKGEKLIDTIKKNDIFISFNSTSLVEAFIYSKICLQLLSLPLNVDNFEKLGICNKTFKNFVGLEKYLKILANTTSEELDKFRKKFNNDYIDITHEPSKRFLEILEDIKKNKAND